jgi:hypothetical protein
MTWSAFSLQEYYAGEPGWEVDYRVLDDHEYVVRSVKRLPQPQPRDAAQRGTDAGASGTPSL